MDTATLEAKILARENVLKKWGDHPNRTEIEKDIRNLRTQLEAIKNE
jgi:hypothetical protein